MREHSLPACSVGLVGREVGNWKGPELTPLCATTEAGQLRSPPCFAGGGVQLAWKRIFPTCQLLQCPGKVVAARLH